ncbi:MAG: DUF2752 domain-containing protein [Candidatus Gastranaerophilaceae bacterium]
MEVGNKLKTWFVRINIILLPLYAFLISDLLIKYSKQSICLFKLVLNLDCWGCGMTRAFHSLCLFRINEAYNYNSKIFIVVAILLYIYIMLIRKEILCKENHF